jgi:hypothetical protein
MKRFKKEALIKVRDTEEFIHRAELTANEMQMNRTDFLRMIMHTGVSYYEKRLKALKDENLNALEDASSNINKNEIDDEEYKKIQEEMKKFR